MFYVLVLDFRMLSLHNGKLGELFSAAIVRSHHHPTECMFYLIYVSLSSPLLLCFATSDTLPSHLLFDVWISMQIRD
jgi:hypothetical protein